LARPTSPTDVFINCPFDGPYQPIFDALIFTIFACGFRPRSARELDDGGQTRIDKIYGIMGECRYGIHDISRTELDDKYGLPRFNMPLELGIYLGAKHYGNESQKQKQLLIFDSQKYRYQKFISDIAGIDIHSHGGRPAGAIAQTRDWLANVSRRHIPSSDRVIGPYRQFRRKLPAIADALQLDADNLPYVDYERIVVSWLVKPATP
jgi:hypothetical protein